MIHMSVKWDYGRIDYSYYFRKRKAINVNLTLLL